MESLLDLAFDGHPVRVYLDDNSNPWWVVRDVCQVLDITDTTSVTRNIESGDIDVTTIIRSDGKRQQANIINESGLYNLIFVSRKQRAREFKKWVTSEVLPSIRQTGSYSINLPKSLPEALRMAADLAERQEALINKINALEPKAEHYDEVMAANNCITIAQCAKMLAAKFKFKLGQNRLFNFMREQNILQTDNCPYQQYVNRGYFKLIEVPYTKPDGEKCLQLKTLVTPKGAEYLSKRLQEDYEVS